MNLVIRNLLKKLKKSDHASYRRVEVEEIRKQLESGELDAAALLHGAPALLGGSTCVEDRRGQAAEIKSALARPRRCLREEVADIH